MQQTLPFQQLQRIEEIFEKIEIEDLILVFTQTRSDHCLLVYNREQPPATSKAEWQTVRLREIKSADYANFDGLVVGLSAVDAILPDVPTHGPSFYAIRHILRRRGLNTQWQNTTYRFAQTLLDYLEDLPDAERKQLEQRGHAKIIQLALPTLLRNRPLENVVAILSDTNLRDYLNLEQPAYQLVYNDPNQELNLDSFGQHTFNPHHQWVIAFEEIALFHRDVKRSNPYFLELRSILWRMGQSETLQHTCRQLARRCWQEWQSSAKTQFRDTAYLLAAESWLIDEDVLDLIALLPHEDFTLFLETGDALRIYRAPQMKCSPKHYSLDNLIGNLIDKTAYTASPLSFQALKPILESVGLRNVLDLGPVLWKANHSRDLARTCWLLSRDLLRTPGPEWQRVFADPAQISDLAIRAVLMYGLSDPWQWRQGRYDLFLRDCYEHLAACLLNQEEQADNLPFIHYFRALRQWYGCFTTDEQFSNLSSMVRAGRTFYESCSGNDQENSDRQLRCQFTADLVEIGEYFISSDNSVKASETKLTTEIHQPFVINHYLRDVADSQIPVISLSRPFLQQFHAYSLLSDQWANIREMLNQSRPPGEAVDTLLTAYKYQQRIVYAPAHELAVLQHAFAEDIKRINRLIQAIEIGPIIKIAVKTPWVTIGVQQKLRFDVENIGGAVAYQFKLDLNRTSAYELYSSPATLILDTFTPGQRETLRCEIKAIKSDLSFHLSYTFRNRAGHLQEDKEVLHIEVHQPGERNVKPRKNPYQTGLPVYGKGRFFGRTNELEEIINKLTSGITKPMLLLGPRRIGKTSLLKQLELLLGDSKEQLRLGLSEEQVAQLRTIRPVMTSLQSMDAHRKNYAAEFLGVIWDKICATLNLELDPKQTIRTFENFSPFLAFKKLVNLAFQQRPHSRLLILIDEWDELYREEYSQFGRNLRYLMQDEQRINWIFSSTWFLSKEGGSHSSPFYNQLISISLSEMRWESAIELVTELGNQAGIHWQGEAIVTLLEQTGQRPYFIQLLCSKIVDYLFLHTANVVDTTVVSTIINQIIEEAQQTAQYFSFLWSNDQQKSQDRVRWLGRLILWTLNKKYPTRMSRSKIKNDIFAEFNHHQLATPTLALFNHEFEGQIILLDKVFDTIGEENGQYTFAVPLVRHWLHRVIAQEENFIELAHAGLMQELQELQESTNDRA